MTASSTSIRISALREAIWALLTDAAGWTEWNTTVDKVEGRIAPREKVTVYTKVNPGRAFR